MEISNSEQEIIIILRDLKPYEVIEIHADKLGKKDFFLVKREQKIVIKPEMN